MKIVCSGRQRSVRDDLRELAQKKLSALNKYFSDDVTANVTFKVRRDVEIIEVTIQMRNTLFRSEEGADTVRTALDKAVDTLERQIRRNKTRLQKRIREGAFAAPAAFPEGPDYEEEPEFSIRTKTYPIRPMSVEEAILQMNLLEHQFFVFVDDVDQETRVVYRRKDGGYGLIIPE